MAFDIYQAVTDRIVEMLDKGTVPWRHPIHNNGGGAPKNIESGKPYRGVNVFLLGVTSWLKGYGSAYWLTFRQAQEKGGNVRRGERSSMVVFWKMYETKDRDSGQPKKVPVLRYFNVFNADQVEGMKAPDASPEPAVPFEPIAEAEKIVAGYTDGPKIQNAGNQAFYQPATGGAGGPTPSGPALVPRPRRTGGLGTGQPFTVSASTVRWLSAIGRAIPVTEDSAKKTQVSIK
jgi:antirestriction protein ArdC